MNTTKNNSPIRPLLAAPMLLALALASLAPISATLAQAPAPAQAPDAPESKPETPATGAKVNKIDLPFDNLGTNQSDPNAAVVYLIKVRGEVGTDFSATPLKRALDDAKRFQPDVIVLEIDSAVRQVRGRGQGKDGEDWFLEQSRAFDSVDSVTEISTVLIDDIRDNKGWVKKPRVVAWVKRALGPAAFLPFVCKDVYYTPDAVHGGIGYLDYYFNGIGDNVVREKQRSLRMGRAEGLAVKGGHDFRILRAMAREDYVLSYTMVGGKPEFYEDMSGDTILTDDGNEQAGRQDSFEDYLRNAGNDTLTLTTPVAKRIGFIEGEAATLDDLAFELGIQRAYKVYGRRADRELAQWRSLVDNVTPQIKKLLRDRDDWRLEGNNSTERNTSRNKLKRIYLRMIDLASKNKEVARANGLNDEFIDRVRQQIAVIDQQIRLDRED